MEDPREAFQQKRPRILQAVSGRQYREASTLLRRCRLDSRQEIVELVRRGAIIFRL